MVSTIGDWETATDNTMLRSLISRFHEPHVRPMSEQRKSERYNLVRRVEWPTDGDITVKNGHIADNDNNCYHHKYDDTFNTYYGLSLVLAPIL